MRRQQSSTPRVHLWLEEDLKNPVTPSQISLIGNDRRPPPCQNTNLLFLCLVFFASAPNNSHHSYWLPLAFCLSLRRLFRTSLNNLYVGSCGSPCLHGGFFSSFYVVGVLISIQHVYTLVPVHPVLSSCAMSEHIYV